MAVALKDAVWIVDWRGFSFAQQGKVVEERVRHKLLGEEGVNHHGCADKDALEVLGKAERHKHEGAPSDLHYHNLEEEDRHYDAEEEIVVEEVLENVQLFLLDLARIEEVEDLQEDENVEEDGEVLPVVLVPLQGREAD